MDLIISFMKKIRLRIVIRSQQREVDTRNVCRSTHCTGMWRVMGYGRVQGNPKITMVLVKLSVMENFRRFIEGWGERKWGWKKHITRDQVYCWRPMSRTRMKACWAAPASLSSIMKKISPIAQHVVVKTAMRLQAYW